MKPQDEIKRTDFDIYFEKNPREALHESMKGFLDYAQLKYKDLECVNATYSDDEEEQSEEVERYINDSMEVLLLYKEYISNLLSEKDKQIEELTKSLSHPEPKNGQKVIFDSKELDEIPICKCGNKLSRWGWYDSTLEYWYCNKCNPDMKTDKMILIEENKLGDTHETAKAGCCKTEQKQSATSSDDNVVANSSQEPHEISSHKAIWTTWDIVKWSRDNAFDVSNIEWLKVEAVEKLKYQLIQISKYRPICDSDVMELFDSILQGRK